ncbi:MAG: hypothetical protein KR126chlam3_00981 [Chlamydiae bacterium]|nr:hypothetical protein [Chlamydiota bacterium]
MPSIPPTSNTPVSLEGVYYVESPGRPLGHIAIRPKFREQDVEWDDTSTGISMRLDPTSHHWEQLKSQAPNSHLEKIAFVYSKQKKQITLRYLTLELYNEKLKSKVAGKPSFSSTEELQKYYLSTDFYRTE